jgi:hypothetical protein
MMDQGCKCGSESGCSSIDCQCFRGYCDSEVCGCSDEKCIRRFKGCQCFGGNCNHQDCPCFREKMICKESTCTGCK